MKKASRKHKTMFCLLALLIFSVTVSAPSAQVFAQQATEEEEQEFLMGIQILESEQQVILDSINKVKELQLGNMIILHPMDQGWNLELIEEAIETADSLGLYVLFETFNFSDHDIRISPDQFGEWQSKYPRLLGILVQEVTGKQVDMKLWENNSTGIINTRLEAEEAIIGNITASMKLAEFKEKGAKIFLQENVVSYASANTSYCDVLITKCFNSPNTELVIGLTRGMAKSYDIPAWGLWVDTWREWIWPPAFKPNDVERALYEGWFYGAKYFFFEQGNFFGTLNRTVWPNKYIVLGEDGKLTDYGKVLQSFFIFLQNQNTLEKEQPDYSSDIAVMIGQSGWASRGKDWGLWEQLDRQGDFDYTLLNLFFPGIGDNWQIGSALTGKEFTGLPFGMVEVISIYAPPSVMKQYKVVIALGWSQMSDSIAANIEEYVDSGGVFFSLLTFTHSNEEVDDLEDPEAWTDGFRSLFGVQVMPPEESGLDVRADSELRSIVFTQDTFWHQWSGKSYSYVDENGEGSWFWKYKYIRFYDESTTVLAWVNGIQTEHNAFIIEHKKGAGYTYIVNTRNPNTLPDGVLTTALTNFVYQLCAYYVKPLTFLTYPENEYWLGQGQTMEAIYLNHDNSTAAQTFTYHVDVAPSSYNNYSDYIVFEFLNKDYYGYSEGQPTINLNLTLQSNESKLFLLFEDYGEPQVLYSEGLLTATPTYENQRLTVSLQQVEEASNTTQVFCSQQGQPSYILGLPYNISQDYNPENKILTLNSNSDITVGWENTTEVKITESTAPLTSASWNSTLGTFEVSAKATTGQQATIELQMEKTTPYYVKLNGTETQDWSYDPETGILSTSFTFTSDRVNVVFGFKPLAVDAVVVSDRRADVGSVQSVGFHVSWLHDNSDAQGATVRVNGTYYVTNSTGWISFDVTSEEVGKTVWNVTDVNIEGQSTFAKAAADPYIVWDRINVTGVYRIDELVQSGSQQRAWLTAEYDYDNVTFDETKGVMYLNGEAMSWSSQNRRWELTVTSEVLGPIEYAASEVTDEAFGLTEIHTNGMTTTIMWDTPEVAKTEFDTTGLGVTDVFVHVGFSYNKNPIRNATVFVNGKQCIETEVGTYKCTLEGYSPLETFDIEANTSGYAQATLTVSALQESNTILYSLIVSSILVTIAFFLVKRKDKNQKTN